MELISKFKDYCSKHFNFKEDSKILLAVSGGLDSVVMLDLFVRAGFTTGIVHCNFNLRGDESAGDEAFVASLAKINNVPYFVERFDTIGLSKKEGVSVQMKARELRYAFFDHIANQNDYEFIATAHHRDDDIETLLINLIRGTGIRGMQGVPLQRGKIIRPMKIAYRQELEDYARNKNILFREDSSNKELKYLRNEIRQTIIPRLVDLNPDFKENTHKMLEQVRNSIDLLDGIVSDLKKEVITFKGEDVLVEIDKLLKLDPVETWMYELLREYGFTSSTIRDVCAGLKGQAGKEYFSDRYQLIRERKYLKINKIVDIVKSKPQDVYIDSASPGEITEPLRLSFDVIPGMDYHINPDRMVAALDIQKLKFPLKIRRWRKGDRFMPLGMQNFKKVSDFLVDDKIELSDKKNIRVLESDNEIVWVIGHRIDNRYRLSDDTETVFEIRYIDNP